MLPDILGIRQNNYYSHEVCVVHLRFWILGETQVINTSYMLTCLYKMNHVSYISGLDFNKPMGWDFQIVVIILNDFELVSKYCGIWRDCLLVPIRLFS